MEVILFSVVTFLLSILVALVGWIANRIFIRMDLLVNEIDAVNKHIVGKLNEHHTRITVIEKGIKL